MKCENSSSKWPMKKLAEWYASCPVNGCFSPRVGAIFSAMKTEYVVVVEQAHPLGPAYSFPIPMELFFVVYSHPLFCFVDASLFWYFHPYIFQHNVFTLVQ